MKKRALIKYVTSIFFIVVIALIASKTMLSANAPKTSSKENRALALLPTFSGRTFLNASYQDELEDFYQQNIYLRDFLLEIDSLIQKKLLLKNNINDIYFGTDNQLLGKGFSFDESNLETVDANIQKICELSDYLSEKDIKLYLFNFPSNTLINQDKIKSQNYKDETQTLIEYIEGTKVAPYYYDFSAEFFTLNQSQRLYFKTDHHWNHLGGYYAYKSIVEILERDFSQVQSPIPIEDIQFECVSDNFLGSYARSFGKYNVKERDRIVKMIFPQAYDIDYHFGENTYKTLFNDNALRSNNTKSNIGYYNEYLFYSYGDTGLKIVNNNGIENDITLTIFSDSYMNIVLPYLANSFNTIYVIDPRASTRDVIKIIDKSDAVLYANLTSMFVHDYMTRPLNNIP